MCAQVQTEQSTPRPTYASTYSILPHHTYTRSDREILSSLLIPHQPTISIPLLRFPPPPPTPEESKEIPPHHISSYPILSHPIPSRPAVYPEVFLLCSPIRTLKYPEPCIAVQALNARHQSHCFFSHSPRKPW